MKRLAVLVLVTACGGGSAMPLPDARAFPDGSTIDALSQQPYRHAIVLDGIDDFAAGERFTTTSATYDARIAWDNQYLYIGYAGSDLAPSATDASTKWLFVYLDTTAGGETQSMLYNTQRASFPQGFAADYYVRYKCDGTYTTLEMATGGGAWQTVTPAPSTAQAGTFVELALPLSGLGAGARVGIVTWMINEKSLVEGSYAGLYSGNFTDGYAPDLALTKYLQADFTSPRSPNDPANQKP